jgi:hypothetical protein
VLGERPIHLSRRALSLLPVPLGVANSGHGLASIEHLTAHVFAMPGDEGLREVSTIFVDGAVCQPCAFRVLPDVEGGLCFTEVGNGSLDGLSQDGYLRDPN